MNTRLLVITRKDLLQSTRSLSALVFMFGVPILVTVLFSFMFGGMGGDGGFTTPRATVVIYNGDQGQLPAASGVSTAVPQDFGFDTGAAQSMGELLVGLLKGNLFADLLGVTTVDSPDAARTAVAAQQAAAAIIIPENFTAALTGAGGAAEVELVRDPALALGPMIVEAVVRQMLDRFAAGTIGTQIVLAQVARAGLPITADLVQDVVARHTAAAFGERDAAALIAIQEPPGANAGASFVSELLGVILGGMMTFFAFFTGAATIETILVEEERGTLQRLFTTPTSRRTILYGKMAATLIVLTVQLIVLVAFGAWVFGIDWGRPLSTAMAGAGMILLAAATGLFLVSFLQNTRQSGVVFGGLLTLTGMLGMMPVFGGGVTASPVVNVISLLVPQGWAVRGLLIAQGGGAPADLAPTLLVILLWAAVFAGIGLWRLQRRFA